MKRSPGIRAFPALMAMLILVTFSPLLAPRTARAAADPAPASAQPQCVPDVPGQFAALRTHGEALGFRLTGGVPDPTLYRHFQGIQRREGPGKPYFFVSRSGNKAGFQDPDLTTDPGDIFIVKFDSRDESGERLRSNRMARDESTRDTPPPLEDRVVAHIRFDGNANDAPNGGNAGDQLWPAYGHPGGMQIFDNVLVVSLEAPANDGQPATKLVLVDVADPEAPVNLGEFLLADGHAGKAGVVAVTRRADNGKLLLVVTGDRNERLFIYESNVGNIRDGDLQFQLIDEWSQEELTGGSWHTGMAGHQSFFLAPGCNGELFMLGTRNNTGGQTLFGEDWTDLYRVHFTPTGDFKLTLVSERHFYCEFDGPEQICDFAAAGGFHVTPAGELILYGTEHEDTGPDVEVGDIDDDSVRMAEFRSGFVYRPGSPNLRPTAAPGGPYSVAEGGAITLDGGASVAAYAKPWAELYHDPNFEGRGVAYDWADRFKDNFEQLGAHLEFGDKASSVRWRTPVGCDVIIYADPGYTGTSKTLPGNGGVQGIADLGDFDLDDEINAIAFSGATCGTTNLSYGWDLDGQAGYEAAGQTVPFSAANLDGPARVNVGLRVCGPYLACHTAEGVAIEVRNAPPVIQSLAVEAASDEASMVTLSGVAVDPGKKDEQAVTILWGDGARDRLVLAPGATTFSATHWYWDDDPTGTPADTYTIGVTVVDDDGAEATGSREVTVRNVAPVATIDAITDEAGGVIGVDTPAALQGLPVTLAGRFSDAGFHDAHIATIDWGDGTAPTTGASGSHVYTSVGEYTITLRVVDDDGGVGQATRQIAVQDAAGAAQSAIDLLKQLLADPTLPPASASAIRDAIAKLEGNASGGATNGALAKLANGDLAAALVKIEQSLGYLTAAEAANPAQPLTAPKRALTLAARSVAVGAIAEAEEVAATPAAQERVAQAKALLAQGDQRLRAGDYAGAVTQYKAAVSKAQEALKV